MRGRGGGEGLKEKSCPISKKQTFSQKVYRVTTKSNFEESEK